MKQVSERCKKIFNQYPRLYEEWRGSSTQGDDIDAMFYIISKLEADNSWLIEKLTQLEQS